jgi:hypothetical protein
MGEGRGVYTGLVRKTEGKRLLERPRYRWEDNNNNNNNKMDLLNPDNTMYMVMSRNQTAGRCHSMKTDNSSFERVEEFKYLGTTLTNQNSM